MLLDVMLEDLEAITLSQSSECCVDWDASQGWRVSIMTSLGSLLSWPEYKTIFRTSALSKRIAL